MAAAKIGFLLIPVAFPFPDGADTLRSLLLENKIPLVFFCWGEVFIPFHFIYLTLIWTAVGTSTFKQNSYFSFLEPCPREAFPNISPFSGISWWRDRVRLCYSPPFMCPFMSPILLSSQLHFHALWYRFWSPFVHNVMLFMSFLSAVSAFLSCSPFLQTVYWTVSGPFSVVLEICCFGHFKFGSVVLIIMFLICPSLFLVFCYSTFENMCI